MSDSHWMYQNKPFIEPPEGAIGFVYVIEGDDGMKYIGKKEFMRNMSLPPLKGKKRKRKKQVESDWRNYWGSSKSLLADIERNGKQNYRRRIIGLGNTKAELVFLEARAIMMSDALISDQYYNEYLIARVSTHMLKGLMK